MDDSLIIDAIKFRIRERNAACLKNSESLSDLMCEDVLDVVNDYCDDLQSIDESVAAKCMNTRVATCNGHTLTMSTEDRQSYSNCIAFTYTRMCKPFDPWLTVLTSKFEWSDYIKFILTGYSQNIFRQIYRLIKYIDYGEFEKYVPCCANSDAKSMAVRLLTDLRSEILKCL